MTRRLAYIFPGGPDLIIRIFKIREPFPGGGVDKGRRYISGLSEVLVSGDEQESWGLLLNFTTGLVCDLLIVACNGDT